MSGVFIGGAGAVSAAGWGMVPLRDAVARGVPMDVRSLDRPGWDHGLRARGVPPPPSRPAFLSHPRLRRSSSITHYAVAAAIEALGGSMTSTQAPIQPAEASRLGIVYCVMSGCVSYSRRFYHEVIQNPSTASPLLFPETVFNAPASHLSAYLGVTSANYTLVGDAGGVLVGLATGARWIREGRVDRCLLVGAEELDWLTVDAFRHFDREWIFGEGAGALLLQRAPSPVELDCVTDAELFTAGRSRMAAARRVKEDLPLALVGELLCDVSRVRCGWMVQSKRSGTTGEGREPRSNKSWGTGCPPAPPGSVLWDLIRSSEVSIPRLELVWWVAINRPSLRG